MATTPRLCELTFLIFNERLSPCALGQHQPGAQRRPVGHGLVGRDRRVGLLARDLLEHLRTIGMRVEPPTSSTRRARSSPARPLAAFARVVNRVRSSSPGSLLRISRG